MAPHEAAALHILGLVLYRTEKYKEAEVWLQKAESIDPESWSIALTLALTKYALGDLDGSVEVFSEAIARAPDEPMRTMIRMQMAHPILASGDYKRGLLLREGRQVPTTQELGAAPAVASSALRVEKDRRVAPLVPNDTNQPLPRPRVVLTPPAPRDREVEISHELDRLARGPAGYSDHEIEAVIQKRKKRRLHRHLIEMAKLLGEDGARMLHPAAAIACGEPSSSTSSAVKALAKYFKEAARKYLSNQLTIDDLFTGGSPSFIKKFTDEDYLNIELMMLDRRRPGFLPDVCRKKGRGRPKKR